MSKNRELKHLRDENRGLKKRVKHITDASIKNHNGMIYWKEKCHNVLYELKGLQIQATNAVNYINDN